MMRWIYWFNLKAFVDIKLRIYLSINNFCASSLTIFSEFIMAIGIYLCLIIEKQISVMSAIMRVVGEAAARGVL